MNSINITDTAALNSALNRLAKLEKEKAKKTAKHQERINALNIKHNQATEPLDTEAAELKAAISEYAAANREELTGGKGKTAKLANGCIKWRKGRPTVKIEGDTAEIIATLRRRRLRRWLIVKEEISKTAILAEAELLEKRPIDGVSIAPAVENIVIEAGA